MHCNTLQRTVAHCNTLQHTATHCNTPLKRDACQHRRAHALQHTVAHCNTLQHTSEKRRASTQTHTCTATHCNTHMTFENNYQLRTFLPLPLPPRRPSSLLCGATCVWVCGCAVSGVSGCEVLFRASWVLGLWGQGSAAVVCGGAREGP